MSGQMASYLPLEQRKTWAGWTLDGAWDHKTPWQVIEEYGDLTSAFRDLWATPKDRYWSDIAAIHYAMVNT